MDDGSEPSKAVSVITNRGILIMMTVLVAGGSIAGFAIEGTRWGLGVLLGGILAFLNYLWLDRSTKALLVPNPMAKTGVLAMKYVLRYVVIGAVLFAVFYIDVFPVAAVIAGLASFAIAVVMRGVQNIFTSSK